ncbi:MAG: DUF2085 domain-containing protein [Candidatus Jordarchaeaceae archaeon]
MIIVSVMDSIEEILIYIFNYIGHLVCHQIPDRTLWIGGFYLPVCARDTGVYIGFFVGYSLLSMRRKQACGPPNLWITLLMVAPMIFDVMTQYIGLRMSTNELRLLTGLLFGTALSPLLIYLFSIIPLSRKLPFLQRILPKQVNLDDKDSWLSSKALGIGLLIDFALFLLINSTMGSTNHLFYWLLIPIIIISIILHIFLLPIFFLISLLVWLKKKVCPK